MSDIEKSLDDTIDASSLAGLTTDVGELVLDSVLEGGTLKDVPVLGAILNTIKLGSSISNFLLFKKVYRFLFEIKDIPIENRQKFYQKINPI